MKQREFQNFLNLYHLLIPKIDLLEGKNENIHEILRYSIFRLKKGNQNIRIIENFDPSLPSIRIDKECNDSSF